MPARIEPPRFTLSVIIAQGRIHKSGVPIHVINFALVLKRFVENGCRCLNEDSMDEPDPFHKTDPRPDLCWQKVDAKAFFQIFLEKQTGANDPGVCFPL